MRLCFVGIIVVPCVRGFRDIFELMKVKMTC